MSAVAITVLPAPGGATSTPVSCAAIALTAARCGDVRVPAKVAEIGVPGLRSSRTVTSAPVASISSTTAVQATSREQQSMAGVLVAGDDARRLVCRQSRAFALEELRVGEGGCSPQAVAEICRHPGDGNLDASRQADLDRARRCGRQRTRARASLRDGGLGQAQRPAGTFGVDCDLFGLLAVQPLNTGEIDPLIGVRLEVLAEEDGAGVGAARVLQRQRDEVAETAGRHRVLVGEQAVIGGHRDRPAAHRTRQQQRADGPRHARGHRSREQHPQVRAVAGA